MLLCVHTNSSPCKLQVLVKNENFRDVRSFTILLIEVALLCSSEIFSEQ